MASSAEGYYALLGVEADATPETIKAAYRRLARETHPDRKVNSTEADRNTYSLHMAQLNEAYAVLSDAKLKREYDDKLRLEVILSAKRAAVGTTRSTEGTSRTGARVLVRPRHEVDPAMVKQFSNHFRAAFLSDKAFPWKEKTADGFDWSLEAVFWSSHYCVAARGSSVIDPATIKKLIDYAQIVIGQGSRTLRTSYFLFLFPFQQMSEWEAVSALCQRFTTGENRQKSAGAAKGIVLLDMQHGRALQFAKHVAEKRYMQLLQRIETPA